jgi:hypothetical protein
VLAQASHEEFIQMQNVLDAPAALRMLLLLVDKPRLQTWQCDNIGHQRE